ncbi:DUF502 domain-containing protein [Elioraea rosea]|uniref:DUF502 domain-containing protein n=1 Tax=Elioraea rosea TaxID=2492390 RepID=UPI001184B4C5|nr:DUF502 domain-containing protein [Elioraea rosea]
MRAVMSFVKTTVIGGVLFLVPVVLAVVVIQQALAIAVKLVRPVAGMLPLPGVSAAIAATGGSILALFILCFVAGLLARGRLANRLADTLEERILSRFPAYGLIKSTAEGFVGLEKEGSFVPALLRYDDAFQIGFVVERLEGGFATVYLPGAPSATSGSVAVMEEGRIVLLGLTVPDTLALLRRLGAGAAPALAAAIRSA